MTQRKNNNELTVTIPEHKYWTYQKKELKPTVLLNMLKAKGYHEELKEFRKITYKQNDNINKEKEIIKITNSAD